MHRAAGVCRDDRPYPRCRRHRQLLPPRRRPLPAHRPAAGVGPHEPAWRRRRGDRDADHRADRRSRQYRRGHQRSSIELRRRQLQRDRGVQSRSRHRRRDAGSPRPRVRRRAGPPRGNAAAGRPEIQQRQRRRHLARALRQPLGARADGAGRQDRQTAARTIRGCGRGPDRRRPRAHDQRVGGCRSARRLPHADYRDPDGARASEPGRPGRQRHRRRHRAGAAHDRPADRPRGVQRPGDQERRRRVDPHPRHRPRRGRHEGAAFDRAPERRPHRRHGDPAADGLEHDRSDRRGEAEPRDRESGTAARRQRRDHS